MSITYVNDNQVKASNVLSAIAYLCKTFALSEDEAQVTVLEAEEFEFSITGMIEVRFIEGVFIITVD